MSKKPYLIIQNVSKKFGNFEAVKDVNLEISKSEFFGLLGSSGCGKSTLLRIIGGFETADCGKIILDGEDITSFPPYKRPLNYMFQSYALFPHLNVFKNISFGLQDQSLSKKEIENQVFEICQLLQLEDIIKKNINHISGGQQQRVALARCIIKKPKLLLLDEPLAAFELINLQKKIGITFIFVTHDQEEAMTLSDRMSIMRDGKILETSSPIEIYEKPKNIYTANFIGTANIFELFLDKKNKILSKELNIEFKTPFDFKNRCKCLIRPEKINIKINDNENIKFNEVRGRVKEIAYLGSYSKYLIEVNDIQINIFNQNNKINDKFPISIGDNVTCSWNIDSIVFLEE